MALYMMASNKDGVAAFEVHRTLGVTCETAWFMLHRIREAMKRGELETMRGTIIADETWIGGDPRNQHASKKDTAVPTGRVRPGVNRHTDKTTVLSLVNKTTGEVRSRVVPNVSGHTLGKVIAENVNVTGSHLHTDSHNAYTALGKEFISHESVNHETASTSEAASPRTKRRGTSLS